MTTNAIGNDEWVGIDDIVVSSSPFADTTPPTLVSSSPADEAANISTTDNIILAFDENEPNSGRRHGQSEDRVHPHPLWTSITGVVWVTYRG